MRKSPRQFQILPGDFFLISAGQKGRKKVIKAVVPAVPGPQNTGSWDSTQMVIRNLEKQLFKVGQRVLICAGVQKSSLILAPKRQRPNQSRESQSEGKTA